MGKKHKKYIPQKRFRQHNTVGQREFVNVVYMEKDRVYDPETGETRDNLYATCTCDAWRSSPEATTIAKIAEEAKAHAEASEGKCQLRQHAHSAPQVADPLSEQALQ